MKKNILSGIETYKKIIENNPNRLIEDININMPGIANPVFTSKNIGVFDGFYDLMAIPIVYDFTNYDIAYISQDEDSKNKYIFITTYFTEIYKNFGSTRAERELTFVYLHELMHERFQHLYKYKQYKNIYSMPQIVYNIAFDIFINTMLKHFPKRDFSSCDFYKLGCRYYENYADLEENFGQLNEKFDLNLNKQELALRNILLDKTIESLSDDELVQFLYSLFKDFFDQYDKIVNQAIQDFLSQLDNDEHSDQNSSSNSGNDKQESSKKSSGKNNKLNNKKTLEEYINEAVKNELNNNSDFKENFKNYASNFSNLPKVNIDYGKKPSEPSVQDRAKMIKASQTAEKLISEMEKHKGNLPGFLRSFANIEKEIPDYIELLQGFSSRFIGTDRGTYSPPNKKVGGSLILPSFIDNEINLLFVVDTSGSMSDESIGKIIAHIKAIIDILSSDTTIHIAFNDVNYDLVQVNGNNLDDLENILKKGIYGGGGSDFTEVFQIPIAEEVDAIIFMSDFYIGFEHIEITKPIIVLHDKNYDKRTLNKFLEICNTYISLPLYPELA